MWNELAPRVPLEFLNFTKYIYPLVLAVLYGFGRVNVLVQAGLVQGVKHKEYWVT